MPIEASSSLGGARAYARQIDEAPVRTRHSLCEQYGPPLLPPFSAYVKRGIRHAEANAERRSVIVHREHILTACAYASMIHHAPYKQFKKAHICMYINLHIWSISPMQDVVMLLIILSIACVIAARAVILAVRDPLAREE